MGMSGGGGSKAVPYINVTPLIDVLLVLLIIFMVVTPLKPKRFKTLIPEQQQNTPADATPSKLTLRVDILKDSKLQLNGEEYGTIDNTSRLSAKLADVLRQREEQRVTKFGTDIIEKTVFIKAPESFKYGEVVKVIDAVKGAGATPVGLQVDALEP
ncbi:MAG: biopolymer transport protein TolR [Acidobacteriota bacterium]|jgi:biopolymer transport protein ExbD/biopolymer transport protein TolR|nr:biopolymer transport protein TolR [Acidobacteriota bacterium]